MHRGIGFYTKVGVSIFLFLAIAGYALYQSRKIIGKPAIALSSPQNGIAVSDPSITVAGTISNASSVTINDRSIIIDESGDFSQNRSLLPGLNVVKIRAENKFGRNTEQYIQIVYKPGV